MKHITLVFLLLAYSSNALSFSDFSKQWYYSWGTSNDHNDWIFHKGDITKIPFKDNGGKTLWLKKKLPKLQEGAAVYIESAMTRFEAKVGTEVIVFHLQYLAPAKPQLVRLTHKNHSEKVLTLKFSTWANSVGPRHRMLIGDAQELTKIRYSSGIDKFIISVITLVLSLLGMVIFFTLKRDVTFLWFAGFCFAVGIFFLKHSDLNYLIFPAEEKWTYINLFGSFTIPIFLFLFYISWQTKPCYIRLMGFQLEIKTQLFLKFLTLLSVLLLTLVVIGLLVNNDYLRIIFDPLTAIESIGMIFLLIDSSFRSVVNKDRRSYGMMFGFAGFLLVAIFTCLDQMGIIVYNYKYSYYSIPIFIIALCNILIQELRVFERLKNHDLMIRKLSHDLRDPFVKVEIMLQRLEDAPETMMKQVINKYTPKIKLSLSYALGMLVDRRNIGSTRQLHKNHLILEDIYVDCIEQCILLREDADIEMEYNLSHRHKVDADRVSLNRIFNNIIQNALDAMEDTGKLWVSTLENKRFVIISIRNSGSFIKRVDRKKVFDLFHTQNKKNGTGYGLATVKEEVQAHGGKSWCTSKKDLGTTFHFTLPISKEKSYFQGELPRLSEDIYSRFEKRN